MERTASAIVPSDTSCETPDTVILGMMSRTAPGGIKPLHALAGATDSFSIMIGMPHEYRQAPCAQADGERA